MIATRGNYEAVFTTRQGGFQYKPVEAWDDEGNALVVREDTGKLWAARSYDNFAGVRQAETHPVVAALPAEGWQVEWRNTVDGTTTRSPLVGWAVRADGWATPIDAVDGTGAPVAESENCRIVPPPTVEPIGIRELKAVA